MPITIDVGLICRPYAIGSGRLHNVSMSGAYVETDLAPRLLARVRIRARVELWGHARTFEIPACVVRRDDVGIGVEWCELAPRGVDELLDVAFERRANRPASRHPSVNARP